MSNGAATQERLPPTILSEEDEARFQGAFAKIVARRKKMGLPLDPNPDINDLFDYRGAWKAGKLDIDEFGHFSSEFKSDEHPNLIVEGRNTKTGEPKRPPGLTSEFLKRQLRDRQDVLRMFEQEEMAHRLEFGEPGAISELEDSIRRGQSVEIEKFNQGLQEGHRLQERMRPSFKGKGLPEQQIAEEGQVHPLVAIARSIGQGPEEFLRTTARELVREPQNGVGREVSKFLQKADPVLGVLMGGVSPGNAQRALKLFESQLRGGVRVGKTGAATLEKAAKGNPLFKRLLKSEDIGGDLQVLMNDFQGTARQAEHLGLKRLQSNKQRTEAQQAVQRFTRRSLRDAPDEMVVFGTGTPARGTSTGGVQTARVSTELETAARGFGGKTDNIPIYIVSKGDILASTGAFGAATPEFIVPIKSLQRVQRTIR